MHPVGLSSQCLGDLEERGPREGTCTGGTNRMARQVGVWVPQVYGPRGSGWGQGAEVVLSEWEQAEKTLGPFLWLQLWCRAVS